MYILFISLQNIFHMVVEVPRWTNAKMEVQVLTHLKQQFGVILTAFADQL